MEVKILVDGRENVIDVPAGSSIAEAAKAVNIDLFGSCKGQGLCCGCSRFFRSGIQNLLEVSTGEPYAHPSNCAEYARTCLVAPAGEGVVLDANRKSRFFF